MVAPVSGPKRNKIAATERHRPDFDARIPGYRGGIARGIAARPRGEPLSLAAQAITGQTSNHSRRCLRIHSAASSGPHNPAG